MTSVRISWSYQYLAPSVPDNPSHFHWMIAPSMSSQPTSWVRDWQALCWQAGPVAALHLRQRVGVDSGPEQARTRSTTSDRMAGLAERRRADSASGSSFGSRSSSCLAADNADLATASLACSAMILRCGSATSLPYSRCSRANTSWASLISASRCGVVTAPGIFGRCGIAARPFRHP